MKKSEVSFALTRAFCACLSASLIKSFKLKNSSLFYDKLYGDKALQFYKETLEVTK